MDFSTQIVYIIKLRRPERKRPLGRSRGRWENIKMDIKILFIIRTYPEYKKNLQQFCIGVLRQAHLSFANCTVNKTGSARLNVTLRSVRVTIVAVEKQ